MDRQNPFRNFHHGKELEKLSEHMEDRMLHMKNRLLTDFGIPLEALTRHVIMGGRSGAGKSWTSVYSFAESKKLNKDAGHISKKSSKRKN